MPWKIRTRAACFVVFAGVLIMGLAMPLLGASGCKGETEEDQPESMPEAIPESEIERGEAACRAYQERVCACAAARPEDSDLAEACELAPAKLSSLDLVLTLNRSPANAKERVGSGNTARRIMASCITEAAALDGKGCPRSQ